jgi:hypothetical protein
MQDAGLIDRSRPVYRDTSIVWANPQVVGVRRPNLVRQTTRHEVAVAAVSARYLLRGYTWQRDRRPVSLLEHQGDGVATRAGVVELIEVELAPKTPSRYQQICTSHATRLGSGRISQVTYWCTPAAARLVTKEADRYIFRTERPKLVAHSVFDARGRWSGGEPDIGSDGVLPAFVQGPAELDGFSALNGAGR